MAAPPPSRSIGIAPEHGDIGVLPGSGILPAVQNAVQRTVQQPAAPVAMACAVLLFLLVQHRIDRRDPKLARGRAAEQLDLSFGAAVTTA
ncbi:MAG: hypothetical protein QOJ79_2331 [Actinomycetota bacterium]|nr:hypothetical protein [Actinomycetota bacterium]